MTAEEYLKKESLLNQIYAVYGSGEVIKLMESFAKIKMIELVESLKEYTHESHVILGHSERTAEEFVEIFLQQEPAKVWYKSLKDETDIATKAGLEGAEKNGGM